MRKLNAVASLNRMYVTMDRKDIITSIELGYDSTNLDLVFETYGQRYKSIKIVEAISVSIAQELFCFVKLDSTAVIKVDISTEEETFMIQLRSEDLHWKWVLSLESRYEFNTELSLNSL